MEYSETIEFEIINKPASQFFISEENVKGKRTNKNFKIGKSFQYSLKNYENRFLIWNTNDNILTITELSTDFELLGNQIEIEFQKSQVLHVSVYETENDIQFLISTSLLVMRFSLHHPKKLRQPNPENFQYSIFYGINDLNEMKHCITPYFNANEITSVNSIIDYNNKNIGYFNYGLSNGSVYTFVIQETVLPDSFSYFEMKEGSLFSKLISGFISRPKSNDYIDTSIQDITYIEINDQIYIVSISRDNKLKLWSLKDRYCVASEDLLESVLMSNNSNRTMSTINFNSIISSHKINSFLKSNIKVFLDTVVVYFHVSLGKMVFTNWIMILVTDPHDKVNSKQPFQIISNINQPVDGLNLIDFEISYNITDKDKLGIWSLVSDRNSEKNSSHSVNWISLNDDDDDEPETYRCRIYNGLNELDIHIEDHQDPQEAIINKIFTPGVLLRLAVVNTLNKYRESDSILSSKSTVDELKHHLVLIVESRVEKELLSYLEQETDIDVMELNRKQWYHIFKECVEEHYCLMEPLGIVSVAGTFGLNRLGALSLMRCPNELERVLSSSSFTDNLYRFYDRNTIVSGCTLLRYLNEISRQIQSTEMWPSMEYKIFQLGIRPLDVTKMLLSMQFDIPSVINSRIENQPEIIENTVKLLETMDIEIDRGLLETTVTMETHRMSSFSMGMLHYAICQVIRDRICLSIAMITLLVPRIMNISQPEQLQNLVQRLECLIKSLISIHWLLTLRQKSSLELTDLQKSQLESLNLLENRCVDLIGTDILCLRILQSLQIKYKSSSSNNKASINWQMKLTEEMSMIVTYLNPNSDMFSLYQICRYFLSYNMPMELIEYLKFLSNNQSDNWWTGDECFVHVMMGLSYLLLNKPWKVVECLTRTIYEMDIASSLLPGIIFSDQINCSVTSVPVLQTKLILKFIDVMENMNNSEPYIISLAETGNKIIDENINDDCGGNDDDELVRCKSIFMTILFKNLLDIGRFNDARLAIMNNPDTDKQKDCLRQFIIVLSDCNQLDVLVQFDYGSLSDEFVNVVHSRACASDLNDCKDPFYNILYSFHIKNKDYKSAANCMLELALRLDNDLRYQGIYMSNQVAIDHMQMQVKAYLTCITVASLLSQEDQLFVFPASIAGAFNTDDAATVSLAQQTGRNNSKDNSMMDISREFVDMDEGTERIIINLNQIKRQYNLIRCRLKVIRESSEHGFIQSGKLTRSLTLTSLLKMGLYWDAIKLSIDFDCGLEFVVTTIATRCAQVSKNCLDRPFLKEKENIIDSLEEINGKCDFASMGSLHKLLWKFLEEILLRFDSTPNGDLCIKACSKLLSGGIELLPAWLIDMVVDQKEASGALLRLYITNGYLEPAVNLTARILDSQIHNLTLLNELSMGFYNTKSMHKHQLKWMSYPVIFNLFDILENMAQQNHPGAKEFHEMLGKKMKIMVNIMQQNSNVQAIQSA